MRWYQCEVGIEICLGSFVGRVVTSVMLTKKLGEVVHGWGFYIGTSGTHRVYTTPAVVRV